MLQRFRLQKLPHAPHRGALTNLPGCHPDPGPLPLQLLQPGAANCNTHLFSRMSTSAPSPCCIGRPAYLGHWEADARSSDCSVWVCDKVQGLKKSSRSVALDPQSSLLYPAPCLTMHQLRGTGIYFSHREKHLAVAGVDSKGKCRCLAPQALTAFVASNQY